MFEEAGAPLQRGENRHVPPIHSSRTILRHCGHGELRALMALADRAPSYPLPITQPLRSSPITGIGADDLEPIENVVEWGQTRRGYELRATASEEKPVK